MKVELFYLQAKPPLFLFPSGKQTEYLIHVNVNHAIFVPVGKKFCLNKCSMKLDSGRTINFIQITSVKLGFTVMKGKMTRVQTIAA